MEPDGLVGLILLCRPGRHRLPRVWRPSRRFGHDDHPALFSSDSEATPFRKQVTSAKRREGARRIADRRRRPRSLTAPTKTNSRHFRSGIEKASPGTLCLQKAYRLS